MLEIHVSDQIKIFDDLKKATEYVLGEIRRWFLSDEKTPLTIQLKKKDNKSPPALEISVDDSVITKGAFG